jgi:hypothetical protein
MAKLDKLDKQLEISGFVSIGIGIVCLVLLFLGKPGYWSMVACFAWGWIFGIVVSGRGYRKILKWNRLASYDLLRLSEESINRVNHVVEHFGGENK